MSGSGLVSIESPYSVKETIDRLALALRSLGLEVFGRIDHAAGARRVEMSLRPTELLLFGNPRAGTPLMQDRQSAGIDLPLKALAWEDDHGKVWLTYNSADWIAVRHGLGATSEGAVTAMDAGLRKLLALAGFDS